MKPLKFAGIVSLSLFLVSAVSATAAENEWKALFDGKDFQCWQAAGGGEVGKGWAIEDGAMVRKEKAGYAWTKERFGDFVLDLEFKTEGNSGIFIRTDNLRNPVQTGIEIQIYKPTEQPSKHSTGAIYDLVTPTKVADKPMGQWNHAVITAQGSRLTVELNGETIAEADLDQWTEAGKNPDGSKNKFKTALKDFKREGHIGLQEHGAVVAFRNVRIREL
jgi:hypothetical protein